MTTAHVIKMSVTVNISPFQDYTDPNDHTTYLHYTIMIHLPPQTYPLMRWFSMRQLHDNSILIHSTTKSVSLLFSYANFSHFSWNLNRIDKLKQECESKINSGTFVIWRHRENGQLPGQLIKHMTINFDFQLILIIIQSIRICCGGYVSGKLPPTPPVSPVR